MPKQATPEVINEIINRWEARAETQRFRNTTLVKNRIEFYCGALAALHALDYDLPPAIALPLMTGREPQRVDTQQS